MILYSSSDISHKLFIIYVLFSSLYLPIEWQLFCFFQADENSLSNPMIPMTRPSPMDMSRYMAGMPSSLPNPAMNNRPPPSSSSSANRHSPIQHSRQSPLMNKPAQFNNRKSPIDHNVSRSRSPLVNKDSPTGRMGSSHPLSDLQRDRSSYKPDTQHYDPANKHSNLLNQSKPLLSEQYETLSDDDS